jgi:hypothetical protein
VEGGWVGEVLLVLKEVSGGLEIGGVNEKSIIPIYSAGIVISII